MFKIYSRVLLVLSVLITVFYLWSSRPSIRGSFRSKVLEHLQNLEVLQKDKILPFSQDDGREVENEGIQQGVRIPAVSEPSLQNLVMKLNLLHQSEKYAQSRDFQEELLQEISSSPLYLEALSRALKSLKDAQELFGEQQAEARVYGIEVLSYLHEQGQSAPLLELIQSLGSPQSESEVFKTGGSQSADFQDLVLAYLRKYPAETLAQELPQVLRELAYDAASESAQRDVYSLLFERLGVRFLGKTESVLRDALGRPLPN